jgi:hypothetical protein
MVFGYNYIASTFNYVKSTLYNVNNITANFAGVSQNTKQAGELASRTATSVTGGMSLMKGGTDAAKALLCNDGPCFVISCIGCVADGLQIIGSYAPGPNVTVVVTMPVSWSCKTLVWLCRRDGTLPWGKC